MITLDGYQFELKDYCSYCGMFAPKIVQETIYTGSDYMKCINVICCNHADQCAAIAQRLKDVIQ